MKKTLVCIIAAIMTLFSYTVFSATAVENVIGSEGDYVILATITGIEDGIFELSKEYVISPKESDLPSAITVEKFRYTYCSEHSESYNNPQIGDNIIINLTSVNGKITPGKGVYKIDTVSHKTLKIMVPVESKDHECSKELLALAHYIRTDGTKTEFEYEGNKVYSLPQRALINEYEGDYITYYSNNPTTNEVITEIPVNNFLESESLWIYVISGLAFLLVLGSFVIYLINKNILNKQ